MKLLARWTTAAAVCALAIGVSVAQGQGQGRGQGRGFGGGGFGFGMGPLQLVQNKDVLEDLKVTDDQKTKLADWAKAEQPKLQEKMREKMQDIPMEEFFQKSAAIRAELNKELWKDVEKVLKPEQYSRIRQISLQALGIQAFTDKETVEKLKLSDEQKEKVKGVMEENQKEGRELFENSGITFGGGEPPDPEKFQAFQKKQTELTKKTLDKLKGTLNDEQKKSWADLTGKEFDIAKLRPQFGARRGGGL